MNEMNPVAVKDFLKSESYSFNKPESTTDKLQRQLDELKWRVNKYFDDLRNVEKMRKEAQMDMEQFRLEAEVERESARKDAEKRAKRLSRIKEMREKLRKTMGVKDDHEIPLEEKRPDESTVNALRYTTTARVCRFIKIGCALVLDVVGAYALFKMTQPYLF